jgi:putative PEP-CTERM system histidine kinase
MALEDVPGLAALPEDSDFARFIERTQWIVDLQQHRASPERYGNAALPAWMREPRLRIVSPILQRGRLTGLFVLYDPPGCFELTYEDRDLLRAVGRHVATHLAQHEADRRLTESQQFETYNRLTAFVMHDLKNAVAPLKLVVANAHRHRGNASFIEDAMFTVENATARIGRLVEELSGASSREELQPTCLRDATRRAIEHCRLRPSVGSSVTFQQEGTGTMLVRAHPDRLTRVIEHVIRNAQDASAAQRPISVTLSATAGEAFLTITDHGCGMAPEFVRERLFRPFDTTKGSGSMGVGAYQARDYAQALGGRVEVESAIGDGTSFTIILPLSGAEAATVPLAGAVPL